MQVVQPGRKPIRVVVAADLEVGRDCDGLLLGDPRTSRRHATLMANAGGLTVLDMGSSNGTFVNGTRIVGPTPVSPNDIVAVGDTTITLVAPPAVGPVARHHGRPGHGDRPADPLAPTVGFGPATVASASPRSTGWPRA